jgi:myxalamid-type polyketide synthase MxaE and MxaD
VLHVDGAYLITGGVGGLGLKVARWLAERGAGHLVLTTRRTWNESPENAEARDAISAIEALGAKVHVATADVADLDQMTKLAASFGRTLPPLRGVVHAATANRSTLLRDMTVAELMDMLRAKVRGTWVLDRLTATVDLDFFVLFSSTTGLLGSSALGHYAAANVFLDAMAHDRRRRGLPAVSIVWGAWDQMRVGVGAEDHRRQFDHAGLRPMPSDRALALLGRLLRSPVTQPVVVSADWATLKSVYEVRRARPFLRELGLARSTTPVPAAAKKSELIGRLADASPEDHFGIITSFLRSEAGRVLGMSADQIDLRRGLFEMGMDSLMSVALKSRLEAATGLKLPTTLTFNYPTVHALAEYLARELSARVTKEPAAQKASPSTATAAVLPAAPVPVSSDESDDLSEDELAARLAQTLALMR